MGAAREARGRPLGGIPRRTQSRLGCNRRQGVFGRVSILKNWLLLAALTIAAVVALLYFLNSPAPPSRRMSAAIAELPATPTFVDERQCRGCHAEQFSAWKASHHAFAMQAPGTESVRGDFDNRTLNGSGTRFSRAADGGFVVRTAGVDGLSSDFTVKYVFGIAPLQQYLLELPRGKLQAFSIAWDVPRKEWLNLYPNQTIGPDDPLHWTQPAHNWNFMCAECHSTDVDKHYDSARDSYRTTWYQINVGCQACHGPGSTHVQWAANARRGKSNDARKNGLVVNLSGADSGVQIEGCARCHSRRSVIAQNFKYGKRLLDFYRPATLDENLYHADGQQQDEVYEYGSFLQSKMARKGLRCSDCHDPHTARQKLEGNLLCATCHNAQEFKLRAGIDDANLQKKNYDSPAHHFHAAGGPGSRCIECHAPAKTYMVVDARIDHAFRIPRPDLTIKIGTPNACNGCHDKRSAAWALAQIRKYHPDFAADFHYGEALSAGRASGPGAVAQLRTVIGSSQYAAIVRSSALRLLQRYPGSFSSDVAAATLNDLDPLVRVEAVANCAIWTVEERQRWLSPLLRDPVRAVRIEAARLLAPLPETALPGLPAALIELEASYTANADRPEARVGLAELRMAQGREGEAENILREVLRLWPSSMEGAVNLADLYRSQSREPEAEALLRDAVRRHPGDPGVLQALAFSLFRQKRKDEAIALLERTARDGQSAETSYLFGLALIDQGQKARGVAVLEAALKRAPGDRNLLLALTTRANATGETRRAQRYLRRLAAINPRDHALPPGTEN